MRDRETDSWSGNSNDLTVLDGLAWLCLAGSTTALVATFWAAAHGVEQQEARRTAERIAGNMKSARDCLALTFFGGDFYCGKLSEEERARVERCMRSTDGVDDSTAIDRVIDGNCLEGEPEQLDRE